MNDILNRQESSQKRILYCLTARILNLKMIRETKIPADIIFYNFDKILHRKLYDRH